VSGREGEYLSAVTPEAMEGMQLSSERAHQLEERLSQSTEPVADRLRLIGFYSVAAMTSPVAESKVEELALWIVEQAASLPAAGALYVALCAGERGATVWNEQLARAPNDAQVHANAARYFEHRDADRATELLAKARALAPDREWTGLPKEPGLPARTEEADPATDKPYARWLRLGDLALEALSTGDLVQATSLAQELLDLSANFRGDWNYGNAVHQAQTILGQLALRADDIGSAKQRLLASSDVTGSPQLDTFGPTMRLAKELLQRGESTAPLEYFERCRRFWTMGHARLDSWRDEVRAGRIPDFFFNER
jgi:hypothetical protein